MCGTVVGSVVRAVDGVCSEACAVVCCSAGSAAGSLAGGDLASPALSEVSALWTAGGAACSAFVATA